jgi:hypothetical protein
VACPNVIDSAAACNEEDERTGAQGNGSPRGNLTEIERWVNLHAIQALIHHASAMIVAIVVFSIVARLAIYLLPHTRVRRAVVIIDDIVLIGLVGWFGWQLFVYLWNQRERLGGPNDAANACAHIFRLYLPRAAALSRAAAIRILARLG